MNSRLKLFSEVKKLSNLWPYLKPHKREVLISALLIPIVALIQLGIPRILQWSIDRGITNADFSVVAWGSAFFFLSIVLEYLFRSIQRIFTARAVHKMIFALRSKLANHLLNLSSSFHDHHLSGALTTRATSDFDNLSEALNQGVLGVVVDLSVLIGSVIGLILLDFKLALFMFLVLPFIAFAVNWFSKELKKAMLFAREKVSVLNAYTQECLMNESTIKLLNAQSHVQSKFELLNQNYRKAQMRSVTLDSFMFSVIDGMSSITIGTVLWGALKFFNVQHALTAGVIIAAVQYIDQIFEPLKQIGNKIAMLQGAFTAIDRIFDVLNQTHFIQGENDFRISNSEVHFDNVSFRYKNHSSPLETPPTVLKNVSFKIPENTSLAIVGATGSGKSTIVKLLLKLYDQYEGGISIGGQNIKPLTPNSLRSQISLVPQDISIFEGTIYFNITLGNSSISLTQVEDAAKQVGLIPLLNSLPNGLNYHLKEKGSNLSEGQKQLIVFARALVKNPKILVLDEATSSVDPASERVIQKAIEAILQNRTVIVIAHRLSTIEKCKQILVLNQGKVIQFGTYKELNEGRGAFRDLKAGVTL